MFVLLTNLFKICVALTIPEAAFSADTHRFLLASLLEAGFPSGTVILFASIVIFLAVAIWNWALRRQIKRQTLDLIVQQEQCKRARREMVESDQKYRELYESSRDGYALVDLNGNIMEFNKEFARMLRYNPEELIKLNIRDVTSNEQFERERKIVNKVMERGFSEVFEKKYIAKDGTTFPAEIRFHIWKDNDGNPAGVWAFVRDITERKDSYLQLQEAENEKVRILDSLFEHVIYSDTELRILWANKAAYESLGLSRTDVIGRRCYELWAGRDKPCEDCSVMKAMRTGKNYSVDKQTPDGRYWHIQGAPVRDSKGNIVGGVELTLDTTERSESERSLRESEEKYRALSENSLDIITRFDREKRCLYVNKLVENYIGLSPEQCTGRTVAELNLPEELVVAWEDGLQEVMESQAPKSLQIAAVLSENEFVFDCRMMPEFAEDGSVKSVLVTARDMTETKKLQELALRAQRLEEAGRIAGQVAHDFNNLMGPLVAYPDLIRELLPEDSQAHSYLTDMSNAAQKISDINQQLLTLGRRGHYNLLPLNLNDVVEQVLRQLFLPPDSLQLKTDLEPNLMNINGGEAQVFRAISNLVTNARDAICDSGTITIKTENYYADRLSIKYGRVPKGEYVKLTVSDTGIGIPQEILGKIFDPFFSTKPARSKRGSGLGLSVVHAVLKDHGAYIDCRSVVGEGTSFFIYFPITREKVEQLDPVEISGDGKNILVVDDDEAQRKVSSTLLKKLGYNVTLASSGEEAVELLEKHPQDLIILDMMIADGLDGTETLKRALEINPSQRAMIVSGFAENSRVEEAMKLGASGFLKKPFTLQAIGAAVHNAINSEVNTPIH